METKVCKCCGQEKPLSEFRKSRLGTYNTCNECVKKNQKNGHANKKLAEQKEIEIKNAKMMRLKDFTPRELMAELKRRGYKFTMEYTETHVISSKDIEI